jgi:hypothetical protein
VEVQVDRIHVTLKGISGSIPHILFGGRRSTCVEMSERSRPKNKNKNKGKNKNSEDHRHLKQVKYIYRARKSTHH